MGIKYSSSESSSLIEAMNSNIEIANEITDRLSSGSDHLISVLESGKLQGAAYTAGKNLFSEIIIPSIKKLQSAIDDIQTELSSYKSADAVISGFGELDLDDLKTQKETREKQLAEVKTQIRENEKLRSIIGALGTGNLGNHISKNNALHELEYQLQMGIDELKDKIEKLEWFVLQVSQYFSDSLQVLSLAIQGATQLSKIIVDNNGNYYVDGVDMTWFDKMKNTTLKNHDLNPIDKSLSFSEGRFINTLQVAYGFNETESKIIYDLYEKLRNKYGAKKANIEFIRLMAEISYSGISWYYTAGLPSQKAEEHFVKEMNNLGFKDPKIDLIKKALVNQNKYSGLVAIKESDSKEIVEEKLNIAADAIFGISSFNELDTQQKEQLEEMLDRFGGKADYTHQNAVISTYFNESPMEEVADTIFGILNERAGYLGDVAGANGAPPSMGNDDYKADLDAVNIYYRIKNNRDYVETVSEYYDEVESQTKSRAREFVVNLGNGNYDEGILHLQDKWLTLESKIKENPEVYEHWGRDPMYTFNRFLLSIIHDKNDLIEEK